jgi:hypothetical protein
MSERAGLTTFLRRAAAWSAAWLAAGALYLLLIDTTDLPELLVAAAAAALAATAFELARKEQTVGGLRARLAWLARGYRPVRSVPGDVMALTGLAFRQLVRPQPQNGVFRAVPFRCAEDQELETGRCAVAEWAGSFSPNTIVAGVDAERDLILAHQLRERGGREAIDVLGLGGG